MTKGWMMVLGMVVLAGVAPAHDAPALKTQKEKVSYALGMDLGNQLKKMAIEVDPAIFGQGLKDSLTGGKALLTEEEVRAAIARLQADIKLRSAQAMRGTSNEALLAQMAEENKKADW